MGAFVSVSVARPGGGGLTPSLILVAIGLVSLFGASALANTFGQDGTALWIQIAAPGGEAADVVGKLVAGAAIVLGLCTVAAGAICLATGHLATLPAALGLAAAIFGCGSAVTLNVAVTFPIPVPDSSNAFTSQTGRGCMYGLISLATLVVAAVLASPVAVLAFTHGSASAAGGGATFFAGLAWGVGGAAVGAVTAARHLRRRGPDILQEVVRY
jgi:ABC-2 type transport system permease protein